MKGFEVKFEDGLFSGLRREENTPRNEESLVECFNWMPDEERLLVHDVITYLGE